MTEPEEDGIRNQLNYNFKILKSGNLCCRQKSTEELMGPMVNQQSYLQIVEIKTIDFFSGVKELHFIMKMFFIQK